MSVVILRMARYLLDGQTDIKSLTIFAIILRPCYTTLSSKMLYEMTQ